MSTGTSNLASLVGTSDLYQDEDVNYNKKYISHSCSKNDIFISESMVDPISLTSTKPRHKTLIKGKIYPKASEIKVPKNEKELLNSKYLEEWNLAKKIEIETEMES